MVRVVRTGSGAQQARTGVQVYSRWCAAVAGQAWIVTVCTRAPGRPVVSVVLLCWGNVWKRERAGRTCGPLANPMGNQD